MWCVQGIMYWPGKIDPGQTTDALVSTMDVSVTFLALAGGDMRLTRQDYDDEFSNAGEGESTGRGHDIAKRAAAPERSMSAFFGSRVLHSCSGLY